jgi:hypothetical protein
MLSVNLRANNVNLRTYNGEYVCAENGGGDGVVANRQVASIWETLSIGLCTARADHSINTGDQVYLKTYDGAHYLCAEGGGGRELVANRTAVGPWETFTIEFVPNQPLRFDTAAKVVGSGKYMHAWGQFQSDGKLVTSTNIFTHVWFAGFTGGVMVCLCDESGNVIGNGPLRSYGVDGQYMPGLTSNRTVEEIDVLDSSIYDKVAHFQVFQEICPHNRLVEDIKIMAEVGKNIAEIFSDFKKALG